MPIDGQMRPARSRTTDGSTTRACAPDEMSDGQRRLLRDLVETYVGRIRDGHATRHDGRSRRHFDETHFCWMGGTDDVSPFYYKVQSPVC